MRKDFRDWATFSSWSEYSCRVTRRNDCLETRDGLGDLAWTGGGSGRGVAFYAGPSKERGPARTDGLLTPASQG